MSKVLTAILTAALLSTASLATPLDDAQAALNRGQPGVTIAALRGRMDAPALNLLARAYVGQSVLVNSMTERSRLYAASETAARSAIAADARSAEAHVELANALALQLQGAGMVRATRTGLEIRRLFEQALALDSTQARAWMGLGTWHAQALGLGPLVVLATGASEEAMRASHRKAIALAPGEVFFRLSYADSLLLLAGHDARRAATLRAEARQLLGEALALKPQTYWQRHDQEQVRERLRGLP